MTPRSPLHAAALEYAGKFGWWVFPLQPGKKEPLAGSQGYHDATTDPAKIDAWWTANPNANVGIAVAPSNLVVLDVDVGKKKDGTYKRGRASLSKIEAHLAPTLLASGVSLDADGNPGVHAYYTRPEGVAPIRATGILEHESGLDLIGDGYIIAAPSYFAESGRYYQWTQFAAPAPLPPFLATVAHAPRPVEKVQLVGTPIPEGGRNAAMFKLGAALRSTGIGAEALARAMDAENKQRFNPPLDDHELRRIVNNVLNGVEVRHDAALAAVVQQEIKQIFAPTTRAAWLEAVSHEPQPPVLFYSTGFPELDALLSGGLATRQLAGIIGPPSAGKSALVGHWLLQVAMQRPVLHASLELTRHELFVRYAAHQMDFPWVEGIKGKVSQESMAGAVRGIRIKLLGSDDFEGADPLDIIEMEARAIYDETGMTPAIAIDYMQLLSSASAGDLRVNVGSIVKRTRAMAQKLDTVILGVFSTSRSVYGNKKAEEQLRTQGDPTAYLAAAKESGDIDYHCATIMYLDVDKMVPGAVKPARLAVARVRVGSPGFVGLRAKLDSGTFWADETVLAEFGSDVRAAKREEATMERAAEAVMQAVVDMPNRPWRDVQARASMSVNNRTMVDRARNKLLEDGVLEKVRRYDPITKRAIQGDTYVVRNTPSPPAIVVTEDPT